MDIARPERTEILVADIVDDTCFKDEAHRKLVDFNNEGGGVIARNAKLPYLAIRNVIRNAVKHTAEAIRVDVYLEIGSERQLRAQHCRPWTRRPAR